jgi:hypothetical protein
MLRCIKSRWTLAGLCGLAAMFAGPRDAQAVSTLSSSITITGGYMPGGGDPPFTYTFNVWLNAPPITSPGTNSWVSGDSFTIDALPGLNNLSGHTEPFIPPPANPTVLWSAGASDTTFTSPPPPPPTYNTPYYYSDFTWVYTGTMNYYATTPVNGPVGAMQFLGTFTVTSTYDFPEGVTPLPAGSNVSYTYNGPPNGGVTFTFPIQNFSVPEPSSAILLSLGAGGILPMFWLAKRRRRQMQQPIC